MFLDVIRCPKIELSLVDLLLVFGVHDALDDGLYGHQVVVNEDEVVLVDLFDVLCDEPPLFVQHLPVGYDLCLAS